MFVLLESTVKGLHGWKVDFVGVGSTSFQIRAIFLGSGLVPMGIGLNWGSMDKSLCLLMIVRVSLIIPSFHSDLYACSSLFHAPCSILSSHLPPHSEYLFLLC
jgi:hypothetical protein